MQMITYQVWIWKYTVSTWLPSYAILINMNWTFLVSWNYRNTQCLKVLTLYIICRSSKSVLDSSIQFVDFCGVSMVPSFCTRFHGVSMDTKSLQESRIVKVKVNSNDTRFLLLKLQSVYIILILRFRTSNCIPRHRIVKKRFTVSLCA